MDTKTIVMMLSTITRKLRQDYYKTAQPDEKTVSDQPSVLSAKQGLGNFPAFYLEGVHCEKSDCGTCANCFYSQYYSSPANAEQIKSQIDYVFDHFEEKVLNEQYGKNEFPIGKLHYPTSKPIFMTLSPTGSWFSEKEFPEEVRKYFLERLKAKSDELKRDIILHIEAHATDVVSHKDHILSSEETELLNYLHAKCILGFESVAEYSRNTLYNKKLPLNTFENAVSILKQAGVDVGAFVFSGLITHTDTEAKKDMLKSVEYLKGKGVFPVLMFANCQTWTIPDILIKQGHAKLQEPYTVLDTVNAAMDILTKGGTEQPGYYLVPEPVDGPPYPEENIFFGREDIPNLTNIDSIRAHKILSDLRQSRDINAFTNQWRNFKQENPSYDKYLLRMQNQEKTKGSLKGRLEDVLKNVIRGYRDYLDYQSKKEQEAKEEPREEHYK